MSDVLFLYFRLHHHSTNRAGSADGRGQGAEMKMPDGL
jgi:hypothetical protein